MPVERLYESVAPLYDTLYGAMLRPGRERAMARLAPAWGEAILEIGVGTGVGLDGYPAGCKVVAIDMSVAMLARARRRLERGRMHDVMLCRMDASRLGLPDAAFDAVYAPYLINIVPDPAA